MGQLLVTLIVPPLVGLLIYYVLRSMWEREENRGTEGHCELITVPAPGISPSETDDVKAADSPLPTKRNSLT
jgi:hypothetical protein